VKWYFVASFSLLLFDYSLTLGKEVEYVWKGQKAAVFYLFLMNRYCPIAFGIITLFAYSSPLWTFEICNRFAIVEWLQTLLIVVPAEIVLLLRIFVLTGKSKTILGLLVCIVLAQCIVVFYAMAQPGQNNALPLPEIPIDAFHVCVLFSNPDMDTAYLSMAIAFDSIVFTLTLASTISINRLRPKTLLLQTIQRDGTLYFCVILSGNVAWMALALDARPGLKLMNAQPSMILTSIMINRLTLSLREAAHWHRTHPSWGLKTFEWPHQGMFSLASEHELPVVVP